AGPHPVRAGSPARHLWIRRPRLGALQGWQARGGPRADDGGAPARDPGCAVVLSRRDDPSRPGTHRAGQSVPRSRAGHQSSLPRSSRAPRGTAPEGAGSAMRPRRAFVGIVVAGAIVGLMAQPTWAHPMGNFSISHYAGLTIGPTAIELRYLVDMAEIATFQEL